MKYIINNKEADVIQFVKYCGTQLPASQGYYKLLRAAINCPSNDSDYYTLSYYIDVFEKQAKKKGIKL